MAVSESARRDQPWTGLEYVWSQASTFCVFVLVSCRHNDRVIVGERVIRQR